MSIIRAPVQALQQLVKDFNGLRNPQCISWHEFIALKCGDELYYKAWEGTEHIEARVRVTKHMCSNSIRASVKIIKVFSSGEEAQVFQGPFMARRTHLFR